MALDIKGSLKNTRVNANRFVVIDELLSNAIDSFLIRQNEEPSTLALDVTFAIEFFQKNLVWPHLSSLRSGRRGG